MDCISGLGSGAGFSAGAGGRGVEGGIALARFELSVLGRAREDYCEEVREQVACMNKNADNLVA